MMVMRSGKRLVGLSSQVLDMRCFSTEIFVSKLSFYTTEEELKDIFSPFGTVKEARLIRDDQTGRVKGFGFVKYSSGAEAEKAIMAMDRRASHLNLVKHLITTSCCPNISGGLTEKISRL